jgi:alpha-glucan phosphorylase-like protein
MQRKAPSDYPKVAYFCMEYGLHESLPLYSGGLGILAGDHCKAASDLTLPFTTIGLFLREGYFTQVFTHDGWQEQQYPIVNPADLPISLVKNEDGSPLVIQVQVGDRPLDIQAWKLQIGHTTMYLLDTDVESNPDYLRALTHRLYSGGSDTRIMQEIVLGIGGLRLLRALNVEVETYHMNEGHCSFLTLELLRETLESQSCTMAEAEAQVKKQCVFTTHTPVEAGHDRFAPDLTAYMLQSFKPLFGNSDKDLLALGRVNPNDAHSLFNMTILGFRFSRKQNGVSALNGVLSRRMFKDMWGAQDENNVPITHITNGIHLGTWAAKSTQTFLTKHVGDWQNEASKPEFWDRLNDVSDEELWAIQAKPCPKLSISIPML